MAYIESYTAAFGILGDHCEPGKEGKEKFLRYCIDVS